MSSSSDATRKYGVSIGRHHRVIFILCACVLRSDIIVANDFLSDDFLASGSSGVNTLNNERKSPNEKVLIEQQLEPRITEPGESCLSISYTHRKQVVGDQSRMEKMKSQSGSGSDKMSRFDLLEEFIEKRCPPDAGACSENSHVLNLTLSRPEQREGFRLVGDSSGDVFSCYPLSDMDFRRSRSAVPGNIRRMLQVARRARAGLTVNVVVIGGSVSHGGACKSYMFEESDHKDPGPCSWANRFVIWMRQHYHNPNIHLISLAQPATTTTWSLTHFDRVLKRNPDLLLVEYGVNDAIVSSSDTGKLQYTAMMRAATELLIRKYLQHNEEMKTDNAILYVVLQRSFDERSYFYPSEVYYPVCKAYGVPVVSVRDAIWPNKSNKREQLWVTKAGAHPIWFGHQLICDILAYTWTVAEYEETQEGGGAPPSDEPAVTGSSLRFGADSSSVDACFNKKILQQTTHLIPARKPGEGWSWVTDRGKEGWEYNLHHHSGVSIEWEAGAHEHELAGRRVLKDRAGLVRKKSKRVARAYGLMQGMDNSVLEGMEIDLKGSDDWIPKGGDGDDGDDNRAGVDETKDDEEDDRSSFDNLGFARKNIPPKKRDGKSMMGIRRKNKKKKEVESQAIFDRMSEDRQYVVQHSQELENHQSELDMNVEQLWSPTAAPIATFSVTTAPTSQLDTALPGIISFPLNFTTAHNNTPTLLLEHLKSWTGYGQAVVWVTKKFDDRFPRKTIESEDSSATVDLLEKQARYMLKMVLANSLYIDKCRSMIFDDHSKLRFSPSCSHIRAGTWVDPTVVDGHWDDHSSQILSSHRVGGLRLEKDPHISSSPLHALIDPALSLFLSIDEITGEVVSEPIVPAEGQHGQVLEGEVHVMMVPWSHKRQGMLHQTRFKVSALYSC